MITLYNTLTKTKERLIPHHDKKIQMFVCGPTVYDYTHIGNARTFVFFDVVAKYLRSQGYEVDYIQNITDIDDKIIQRAKEAGRKPLDWAQEYYQHFKDDMKALGVDSPKYIPATEHIEQVVKQVKTLIDKGHAYLIADDGYYFDLSTFKDYGKLSGRTTQMADDGVSRIDENNKKRNNGDFCLWKFSKPDEPSWDTELGKGRPGWHIEDTAITEHYFGPQYDIHGGGQDLIFPHHEAEITQQESASGKKPFVKYWMHVAFLVNKEQKMSKSLGNFEIVNELLKKYPKEVIRFYLLANHYRSPLDYNEDMFKQSLAAVSRIGEFIEKIKLANSESKAENEKGVEGLLAEQKRLFIEALNDDFNSPRAISEIFDLIKSINSSDHIISKQTSENILDLLKYFDSILGIIPSEQQKIPEEILKLGKEMDILRKAGEYEGSDKLRLKAAEKGYIASSTPIGTTFVAGLVITPKKEKSEDQTK